MRLIDADALKTELDAWARIILKPDYYAREDALYVIDKYVIDKAPTIDAVPVVYGKWINKEPPNADNNIYCTCSNCSAGDLHAVDAVVPYCWKCGAKMEDKPCG